MMRTIGRSAFQFLVAIAAVLGQGCASLPSSINRLAEIHLHPESTVGIIATYGTPAYSVGSRMGLAGTVMTGLMSPTNKDTVLVTMRDLQRRAFTDMFVSSITSPGSLREIPDSQFVRLEGVEGGAGIDLIGTAAALNYEWAIKFTTFPSITAVPMQEATYPVLRPKVIARAELFRVADGELIWRAYGEAEAEFPDASDPDRCDLILFNAGEEAIRACATLAIESLADQFRPSTSSNIR